VRGPLGSGPRFFWGAHAQHAFDEPCAEGEPTTFVLDIGKANLGEPFGENGIVFNTDGGVRTAATSSHTEANLSAPTTTRATTGTPTTKGCPQQRPLRLLLSTLRLPPQRRNRATAKQASSARALQAMKAASATKQASTERALQATTPRRPPPHLWCPPRRPTLHPLGHAYLAIRSSLSC
jgi:hypothetical protein